MGDTSNILFAISLALSRKGFLLDFAKELFIYCDTEGIMAKCFS